MVQRRFSKKKKGDSNRTKARIRAARIKRKMWRQRGDLLHKDVRQLVDKADIIGFEEIQMTNMVKNQEPSSIQDPDP